MDSPHYLPGVWKVFVATAVFLATYVALFTYAARRASKLGRKAPSAWIHLILAFVISLLILTVGLPNYMVFINFSKDYEARRNLLSLYEAQRFYFQKNHTYAGGPVAFHLLHWEPSHQHNYIFYCDSDVIYDTLPFGIPRLPMPDKNWPVDLKPTSSQTGFTCMAVGNIDLDEAVDVWSINDAKILRNDQSDI